MCIENFLTCCCLLNNIHSKKQEQIDNSTRRWRRKEIAKSEKLAIRREKAAVAKQQRARREAAYLRRRQEELEQTRWVGIGAVGTGVDDHQARRDSEEQVAPVQVAAGWRGNVPIGSCRSRRGTRGDNHRRVASATAIREVHTVSDRRHKSCRPESAPVMSLQEWEQRLD